MRRKEIAGVPPGLSSSPLIEDASAGAPALTRDASGGVLPGGPRRARPLVPVRADALPPPPHTTAVATDAASLSATPPLPPPPPPPPIAIGGDGARAPEGRVEGGD
eukprot:scaffold705_cov402-Prasinococcus_capsulatus_cf.AAC.36